MKTKRTRIMKREQNAVLKRTFRERNKNEEGGVGKEEGGRREKGRGDEHTAEMFRNKKISRRVER